MQATREQAKDKLRAKDKRGAIHLLKRAKLVETQINQIYGKKANIDVQIMALESAASNKEIFDVMRAGKDALKIATANTYEHEGPQQNRRRSSFGRSTMCSHRLSLRSFLPFSPCSPLLSDVDKVADVMEDINEQIQMADEVNEQMAQPIGPQMDEDELNQELEEMENELMDSQLLAAPDVPVTSVKGQNERANERRQRTFGSGASGHRAHDPRNTHLFFSHVPPLSLLSAPAPVEVEAPKPVVSAAAPAPAPRQVVTAGGGSSSSASSGKKQLSDKEQREMKELESLMGM